MPFYMRDSGLGTAVLELVPEERKGLASLSRRYVWSCRECWPFMTSHGGQRGYSLCLQPTHTRLLWEEGIRAGRCL